MDFNIFTYFTMGRRAELEAGLAGLRVPLYQRMLDEVAQIAATADQLGYAGYGHPEHHLQIEGCEASNDSGGDGDVHRPAHAAHEGDFLRLRLHRA